MSYSIDRIDGNVVCTRSLGVDEGVTAVLERTASGSSWITAFVTLEFKDDNETIEKRLKNAWMQYSQFEPCINSIVISHAEDPENPRKITTLLDTKEKIKKWADETFVSTDNDVKKYLSPQYSNGKPTLIWSRAKNQLALHLDHGVSDSYGALACFDKVLSLYSSCGDNFELKIETGDVLKSRLNDNSQTLLGIDVPVYESFQEVMEQPFLQQESTLLNEMGNWGSFPNLKNLDNLEAGANGRTEYMGFQFTKEETAHVIKKAKLLNVTVGTLIWATCATAMMSEENNGKNMASLTTFNLRDRFAEKNKNKNRLNSSVTGSFIAVPIQPLEQTIEYMKNYYAKYLPIMKNGQAKEEERQIWGAMLLLLKNAAQALETTGPSFNNLVMSIGVVDEYIKPEYNQVVVKKVDCSCCLSVPGVHSMWLTFQNQLQFTLCYSDAFNCVQEFRDYAENVKSILLK